MWWLGELAWYFLRAQELEERKVDKSRNFRDGVGGSLSGVDKVFGYRVMSSEPRWPFADGIRAVRVLERPGACLVTDRLKLVCADLYYFCSPGLVR